MHSPTDPIGNISRPLRLAEAMAGSGAGPSELEALCSQAIGDTFARLEGDGAERMIEGR
ncbi:hypothetical protein [Polaromonas sp. A23]|uniref:hypothetical protein n=1 Tax=Polaromonas sp. A23 TaxID=1944133 RepID=UPI00143A29DC|nr:hypothetical protein [Polaromonas sp. A23]